MTLLEALMFYVFAATMIGSSLAILLSRDIVRSAVWLLGTLGAAAGLYFLLAANFLAAVQLIVYAGGVLILIVFGVMLTGRQAGAMALARGPEIAVAVLVALVLCSALLVVALRGPWIELPGPAPAPVAADMRTIGNELLTTYLVPFEVASILLLAVMIGAAYLARPEKR